jgi:predicted  nucleic acid-binding Zn-ribbon protein
MKNLGTVASLVPAWTLSLQFKPERSCGNLVFASILVSTILAQTSFSQAAEPVELPAEVSGPATPSASTGPQAVQSGSVPTPGASQTNIFALLDQYLSTSSGRKLAGEIAAILRKGEPSRAEPLLLDAINTGTLASLLVDQLENPSLPMQLEANSGQPQVTTGVDPVLSEMTEAPVHKEHDPGLVSENEHLKDILQLELDRNQTIAQELATARDDVRARESQIAELQESLRQEQSRTEATLASLSAAQLELSKRQGQDDRVGELQANLQQEQERAKRADASVTALKEQLATLDEDGLKHESRIAELEESLKQERGRADGLVRNYTTAQEAASSLEVLKAQNAELRSELDAEREAHGLVVGQLTTARRQNADLESAASSVVKLQRLLQQERDRSTAASHSLANARNEIGALRSRFSQTIEEVLKREYERSDSLIRSGSVQMGFEFFSSRSRVAPAVAKVDFATESFTAMTLEPDRQIAVSSAEPREVLFPMASLPSLSYTAGTTPPDSTLARGPDRSAANDSFASAGVTGSLSVQPDKAASSALTPADAAPVGSSTLRLVIPTVVSKETSLVRRADALLRSGDVSGARLVLERASNEGSAQAAFRLGETYDPAVLSELGALGIRGNTATARELYLRAMNGGVEQAAQRLQALK